MTPSDISFFKDRLCLLKAKGWTETVRILDQHEIYYCDLCVNCTLQIMNYMTGEWEETREYGSLSKLYEFVRCTLEWDGVIRLAVAA